VALAMRVVVIVVGYVAAHFAGWLALVLGEWVKVNGLADILLLSSANAMEQVARIVLRFGLRTAIGFALIPAAVVIAASEWFRLRTILLYGVTGGIIGAWLQFRFTNTHLGYVPNFDWYSWRDLGIKTGAGVVAGLVYWAIAGRNAGRWRGMAMMD
jgi:hypothetical protein